MQHDITRAVQACVDWLNDRFDHAHKLISSQNERLKTLENQSLPPDTGAITGRLTGLEREVRDNAEFDHHWLETVKNLEHTSLPDGAFAALATRVEELSSGLAKADDRIDDRIDVNVQLANELDALKVKVGDPESRRDQTSNRLDRFDSRIKAAVHRITDLESRRTENEPEWEAESCVTCWKVDPEACGRYQPGVRVCDDWRMTKPEPPAEPASDSPERVRLGDENSISAAERHSATYEPTCSR